VEDHAGSQQEHAPGQHQRLERSLAPRLHAVESPFIGMTDWLGNYPRLCPSAGMINDK
jgi:hypothetical protein